MSTAPDRAPDGAANPDEAAARRRQLLLGGGLVASLLLGGVVLLTSGSGEEDVEAFVPAPRPPVTAPAAPGAAAVALPPPAELRQGRNPFAVLYTDPAVAEAAETAVGGSAADDGASGTSRTSVSDVSDPTDATAPTDPADASDPTGGSATSGTTRPSGTGADPATVPGGSVQPVGVRVWIEMDGGTSGLDPAERARHAADGTWTFRVGKSARDPEVADHVVAPGEDFATYFRLLRLQYDAESARQCAQLQFGDSTLDLCEADSTQLG